MHRLELLTRQGDKRIFEINRALIRQGSDFVGTQGIARDVTEHRALLKRVMTSERLAATGRLAAGIAHEINNPLQAIFSHINAVKDNAGDNKVVLDNALQIGEGIDRIRTIVRGMLDLHRTQSAATVDVDLNSLVEKVLALTAKQLRTAAVEVKTSLAASLPSIKGAPSELQQVLLNLVLNASDAMPDGGSLFIETSADATHAEVVVRDSGVGIAPDIQRKIFEPFFSSRQGGGGVGLGLYLSKNIIEIHQGSIQVESQERKGTTFRIRLPLPE
jgi:two-component system NtrC family sensor kinase